ncbi:MAG: hypothetical protein JXM72_02565 [Deltaproteobacteria bacterium]|nr:hypothetical protein [Deltaproteobacteria bacterium]
MRACTKVAVLVAAFLLFLQGCASNTAMPVTDEFWQDPRPVVGVALTTVPKPQVRLRTMYSSGMRVPRILFGPDEGDRDNEERIITEADQMRLERLLRGGGVHDLSQAQNLFVQRLSAQEFSAVAIPKSIDLEDLPDYKPETNGYARRDFRGVLQGRGLDRLIVLQVRWNGVYCHYMGRTNDLTEAAVTVTGKMIDLATNRLLWRTSDKDGTIRKTIECTCESPADTESILEELNALFDDAADLLTADFFANAPE